MTTMTHEQMAENRLANRMKAKVFAEVEKHATWSEVARSMAYKHALGRRWSGREIAAFEAFSDMIAERRASAGGKDNG